MYALEATDVRKHFGAVQALRSLTLQVRKGELISLLGPSGCGKTTLLRIVAGFIAPDSGRVTIAGGDVSHVPTHKRNLGMVFQSYSLWPHMSVAENVAFGLASRGVARKVQRQKVDHALNLVELSDLSERLPRELSGGQQQRVALARALVYEPEILLLDEPLSALDRKLRERMQRDLRQLQQRLGITTIFVTHDQEEALILSDRVAVMSEGEIVQIGSPREIYEHPESYFVADFVGRTNSFACEVTENVDGLVRLATEGGLRIEALTTRPLNRGDRVYAIIRPEKIDLALDGAAADALQVKVESIDYLGAVTYYDCRAGNGTEIIVARQNLSSADAGIVPGQTLRLTIEPEHVVPI